MILRFDQSDRLKVSFGRYHTPINYWNTAFHHGQWLQTTIARPEMIQFGGRFLPVHFVGALVEGSVPAGGWNLNYKAGRRQRPGDGHQPGRRRRRRQRRSRVARECVLEARSALRSRVRRLGVRRHGDDWPPASSTSRSSPGTPRGRRRIPEIIAEVAAIRHEAAGGLETWSHAYYVQARLPAAAVQRGSGSRTSGSSTSASTPPIWSFRPSRTSTARRVGVRYDASQLTALKGEYRTWTRGEDSVRNHGGFFQVCFTF